MTIIHVSENHHHSSFLQQCFKINICYVNQAGHVRKKGCCVSTTGINWGCPGQTRTYSLLLTNIKSALHYFCCIHTCYNTTLQLFIKNCSYRKPIFWSIFAILVNSLLKLIVDPHNNSKELVLLLICLYR